MSRLTGVSLILSPEGPCFLNLWRGRTFHHYPLVLGVGLSLVRRYRRLWGPAQVWRTPGFREFWWEE